MTGAGIGLMTACSALAYGAMAPASEDLAASSAPEQDDTSPLASFTDEPCSYPSSPSCTQLQPDDTETIDTPPASRNPFLLHALFRPRTQRAIDKYPEDWRTARIRVRDHLEVTLPPFRMLPRPEANIVAGGLLAWLRIPEHAMMALFDKKLSPMGRRFAADFLTAHIRGATALCAETTEALARYIAKEHRGKVRTLSFVGFERMIRDVSLRLQELFHADQDELRYEQGFADAILIESEIGTWMNRVTGSFTRNLGETSSERLLQPADIQARLAMVRGGSEARARERALLTDYRQEGSLTLP